MFNSEILRLIAVGGPLLIAIVALFDLVPLLLKKPTSSQVIQWWAPRHPFKAAFFTGFVGAFAAHIFWHLKP